MSYRTHRFAARDILKGYGLSRIDVVDGSDVATTEDTDYPISRLLDGLTKRPWRSPITGETRIRAIYTAGIEAVFASSRVFITGHNIYETSSAVKYGAGWDAIAYWPSVQLADGYGEVWVAPAQGQPLDIEVDTSAAAFIADHRLVLLPSDTAAEHEISELSFSDVFQPNTGVVQQWQSPPREDVASVQVMESGDQFITKHADGAREFVVEHRGASAADLKRYDALFAKVGQSTPFWYDHCDSGDRYEVLHPYNAASEVTTYSTGGTFTTESGPTGATRDCIECTSNSGGLVTILEKSSAVDYDPLWDLSNSYLSIDLMMPDASEAAVAGDACVDVRVLSRGAIGDWHPGRLLRAQELDGEWFRIFMDMDTAADGGGVDITSVNSLYLMFNPDAGGERLRFANMLQWPKERQATRVRFVRKPTRTQDNPVPQSPLGPTYTIRMEMIEVTS